MFAKISKCATFYQSGHTTVIQNIPIHRDKWDFCVQVQVFLFEPKSMNNCMAIELFVLELMKKVENTELY